MQNLKARKSRSKERKILLRLVKTVKNIDTCYNILSGSNFCESLNFDDKVKALTSLYALTKLESNFLKKTIEGR